VTTLSMQGRFDEAAALLEALAAGAGERWEALLDQRRGEVAYDRGDYAAAVPPFERSLAGLLAGRPGYYGVGADLAICLAASGRRDEAFDLARRMQAAAGHLGDRQSIGVSSLAVGLALGGEPCLAALEHSLDVLARSPFRWNQANTELALGAALRAAGQRSRAKEVLLSALEYAVANGAVPIEERARAELRQLGARPRREARTGVAALTPSEERIARLAAEGRTNKEIAQHLFVTVKNVEMHLVHAYRKLQVSSRRDLAAVLMTTPGEPA
jgi:DNA-binding CsgD family transcriptional regulator